MQGMFAEGKLGDFHPANVRLFVLSLVSLSCIHLHPMHSCHHPSPSLSPVTHHPHQLLHGEQFLEVYKPFPTSGSVTCHSEVVEVLDKGKGAVLVINGQCMLLPCSHRQA